MWPFKTQEAEKLEQIIYLVTYKVLCPICKKDIIQEERIYQLSCSSRLLIECSICHIAIYAYQSNIKKIKKTYKRVKETSEDPLGLSLVKEEEIH